MRSRRCSPSVNETLALRLRFSKRVLSDLSPCEPPRDNGFTICRHDDRDLIAPSRFLCYDPSDILLRKHAAVLNARG